MSHDPRGGREGKGWVVMTRELVADLLDLFDAEIEAARQEVGTIWRRAWMVPVLFSTALFLLFWILALVAYALVALLSKWLPAWGAALSVAGGLLLVAGVCVAIGVARVKRLENPYDIFVRRLRDHLDWWRREMALSRPRGEEGAAPGAASPRAAEPRPPVGGELP